MIKPVKIQNRSQSGNAVVIVLIALVVVAVGALAYLSGQMAGEDIAENPAQVASAENATQPASGEAQAAEPADPSAFEIKPGNPVVAKVNGEDINRLDVFGFIQTLPEQSRQIPLPQLFPQALNQVINAKIVEEKAAKVNLDNDPQVKEQLAQAKERIVSTVFLQKEVQKQITDERLQQAYTLYVENFPNIEEVKARHILVEDESAAKDLIEKLNSGGDFAELAKENSTDGTAEKGGDLGYFAAQDVVPEFSEVAFNLEPGSYTKKPVKSQFGFHVIQVEDKRTRPPAEFEQAKPFLETQLRSAVLNGIIEGWRNEAEVERFDINGEAIEPAAGQETPAPASEEAPAE